MAKAVDLVCEYLYEQILSGRYQPGERLREEDLTVETGVSRTPVREALRRLDKEGFIVIEKNRGASFPRHSKRDLEEIYGLRTLLERHAVRLAAKRITPEQIADLERINGEFRKIAENSRQDQAGTKKFLALTQLNQQFHEIIMEAADNRHLAKFVRQLAQSALSAQTFAKFGTSGRTNSADDHDELIKAFKAGKADWAEASMRRHIHQAREIMTKYLDVENDD